MLTTIQIHMHVCVCECVCSCTFVSQCCLWHVGNPNVLEVMLLTHCQQHVATKCARFVSSTKSEALLESFAVLSIVATHCCYTVRNVLWLRADLVFVFWK